MRHLIDPMDLSVDETAALIDLAQEIMAKPERFASVAKGKILAALFYEASTRTRLSFESAMLSLGGSCIGFSSAESSSAAKGESVADTIRVISCYSDICCIRHPKEGSAAVAARHATIPVINAGDGGHQHPTQCLTDLLTIKAVKGRMDNLALGLCGDLMFGRTVHSLARAMTRYPNNRFVLISPPELKLPRYVLDTDVEGGALVTEATKLEDVIGDLDVLYMTRVQKERFLNEAEYMRLKDSYILCPDKLGLAKPDLAVLHPLPRVNEISYDVDNDSRAVYFKQVLYGRFIRMALIMWMLGLTA